MATSGDRYLATSGDFFMATDNQRKVGTLGGIPTPMPRMRMGRRSSLEGPPLVAARLLSVARHPA